MDITPQENTTTQPISDDQELAKALAGVLPDAPEEPAPAPDALQFEETPAPVSVPPVATVDPSATAAPAAVPPVAPIVIPEPDTAVADTSSSTDLDTIKNDALQELRPLIDRVDLPAEEKFDTYLLLIRSTDDSSLIGPAHEAAQNITDEKRKAEALLDIIKEIDYLSRKDQTAA